MAVAPAPDSQLQTAVSDHNNPDQPPAYNSVQPTRLHSNEVVS